jgi:hypothetical protein
MRGFDCKTPHWVSTASMSLKCKNSNSKWTSLPAAAARLIQRSTPACCACPLLTVTDRPGEQSLGIGRLGSEGFWVMDHGGFRVGRPFGARRMGREARRSESRSTAPRVCERMFVQVACVSACARLVCLLSRVRAPRCCL